MALLRVQSPMHLRQRCIVCLVVCVDAGHASVTGRAARCATHASISCPWTAPMGRSRSSYAPRGLTPWCPGRRGGRGRGRLVGRGGEARKSLGCARASFPRHAAWQPGARAQRVLDTATARDRVAPRVSPGDPEGAWIGRLLGQVGIAHTDGNGWLELRTAHSSRARCERIRPRTIGEKSGEPLAPAAREWEAWLNLREDMKRPLIGSRRLANAGMVTHSGSTVLPVQCQRERRDLHIVAVLDNTGVSSRSYDLGRGIRLDWNDPCRRVALPQELGGGARLLKSVYLALPHLSEELTPLLKRVGGGP